MTSLMNCDKKQLLLQKIEELVLDEDEIITNSLICNKLEVNLEEAKELLEKFVSDQKSKKLTVTHLICGTLKDGNYGIQITDELLLEEKKKLFSNISNDVIYSIQKSNVVDFNMIALVDNENIENPLKGSIVSEDCVERIFVTKELPPLPPPKIHEKQKPSSFFKALPKTESNNVASTSASTANRENVNDKIKSESVTSQKKDGKNQNTKKDIKNFFSNVPQKSKNEIQDIKEDLASDDQDEIRDAKKIKLDLKDNVESKILEDSNNLKNEKDIKTKSKSSKTQKANKSSNKNKLVKDGKKRKRIIEGSDSEDDLFENNEADTNEVVQSDEEIPVISPPKISTIPKNKRRKAVEKTYLDEEGYMITKTEYILESASENEDDENVPAKEEQKKSTTKPVTEEKVISPTKKVGKTKKSKVLSSNQPTLMNFFKKK